MVQSKTKPQVSSGKPKTKILRQKPKTSLRQKQKQSVIININTNKSRGGRAVPKVKPSYLHAITTYPIFRENPYEPLYRNSEPVREITTPFIDKTTPTMANTPAIPQTVAAQEELVPVPADQGFKTPPVKTKLRSPAKRVLSIDREVVADPPSRLAVRASLLTTPKKVVIPRRMGIPPRVLGTPDQEAKRAKRNERDRVRYAINKAEKALMKLDESEKSAK